MSFYTYSRDQLEKMLADNAASIERANFIAQHRPDDEEFKLQRDEQVAFYEKDSADIRAELAERDRAEAIPCVPFGKKVRIIEQLPDNHVCAMPKVGIEGTSMGASPVAGRTEVRFKGKDLGYLDGKPANVYIANYALEVIP